MKEKFIESALEKFSSSLYKGLSRAADETAVARARAKSHFGVFFLIAFSFAPFESKEKADNKDKFCILNNENKPPRARRFIFLNCFFGIIPQAP